VTAVTVLQTTQFFGWYDDDDCCDDDDDDAPSIASLYGAGFYYGPGTDTVGRYPGFDTTPSRPSLIELGGFVYTGPRFEDLIRYGGYQRPDYGGYDDRRLVDTDPRGSLIDRPQIDTVPRTDKPLIDDKAKSAVRTDEPAKATTREKIAPEKPAVTPKSAAIKPDQPVSKTEGAPKRAAGAKSAKRTEQKKEKKEGKNEFHIEFYSTRGGSYSSGGSFGGPGGGGFGLGR